MIFKTPYEYDYVGIAQLLMPSHYQFLGKYGLINHLVGISQNFIINLSRKLWEVGAASLGFADIISGGWLALISLIFIGLFL